MKGMLKKLFLLSGMIFCLGACSGETEQEESLIIPSTEEVIAIDVEQIQKEAKKQEQKKETFADSLWIIPENEWFAYWELDNVGEVVFQRVSDGETVFAYCSMEMQDLLKQAAPYLRFDPKYEEYDPTDFEFHRKELYYMNVYMDVSGDKKQEKALQKVFKDHKIKWQTSFADLPFDQEDFDAFWQEFESFASERTIKFVAEEVSAEGLTKSFLDRDVLGSLKKLKSFDCYSPEGDLMNFTFEDSAAILDYVTECKKKADVEFEKKVLNTPKIEKSLYLDDLVKGTEYYCLNDVMLYTMDSIPIKVTYKDVYGNESVKVIGGPLLIFGDDRRIYPDDLYAVNVPQNNFVTFTKATKEEILEELKDQTGYLSYFSEGSEMDFALWNFKLIYNDLGFDVILAIDEKSKVTLKDKDYFIYVSDMGYYTTKYYAK